MTEVIRRKSWRIETILSSNYSSVEDLLTDLRFYCDKEGIDFYALLVKSERQYLEQRRSPTPEEKPDKQDKHGGKPF